MPERPIGPPFISRWVRAFRRWWNQPLHERVANRMTDTDITDRLTATLVERARSDPAFSERLHRAAELAERTDEDA